MWSVSELIAAYRRKGFVFCFRDAMKRCMPLWFTRDKSAVDHIYAWRTYRYLRRRYSDLAKQPLPALADTTIPKKIWICWLQGFENAPVVVKKCVESIEQHCSCFEIIRIDARNMYDYAPIPEHIKQRLAQGRIPYAHFTDVLRTAILVEHGGIWMDADILLTGEIPECILSEQLFMFQLPKDNQWPFLCTIGFIASVKAHPVMQRQLQLLYSFWKRQKGLINYYNYYILFYILVTENPKAQECYDQMLSISNTDALMLIPILHKAFNEKQWRQICYLTPIHILNWKVPNDVLLQNGTYLDFILHRLC